MRLKFVSDYDFWVKMVVVDALKVINWVVTDENFRSWHLRNHNFVPDDCWFFLPGFCAFDDPVGLAERFSFLDWSCLLIDDEAELPLNLKVGLASNF